MRKKRRVTPSKETAGKESNDPLHTGRPWPASDQAWAGFACLLLEVHTPYGSLGIGSLCSTLPQTNI